MSLVGGGWEGKQVVSQAVGNHCIHRFLSQPMNCYILYEAEFWFVGLFLMPMIIFWSNNSWRRKTVREDIIAPCVNFFIILWNRGRQKGKYLSLPPYGCSYFLVISAQTCACHYRHQGYSTALLALSMCQKLVPMLTQLIKTINRILVSRNTLLPPHHFLDCLFSTDL